MSHTHLSTEKIDEYKTNGVILVKNAVSQEWVMRLQNMADEALRKPSGWANDNHDMQTGSRMFTDRYQWQTNNTIRDYIFSSGIASLVGQAMSSTSARFYFDHLLIKEPNTTTRTPWHQDTPYWPFAGKQIASAWLALSESTVEESSMEFIKGSHLDNVIYQPKVFGEVDQNPNSKWTGKQGGTIVPDIESTRDNYDIIGFDVEAGDAIIFSAWILHGAPGNASTTKRRAALSTRWLGDDSIWQPHPGADPTVTQNHVCVEPGNYPSDDNVFPCCWTSK